MENNKNSNVIDETRAKVFFKAVIDAAKASGFSADDMAYLGFRIAATCVQTYRSDIEKAVPKDDPNFKVLQDTLNEVDKALVDAVTMFYCRLRPTAELALIADLLENKEPGKSDVVELYKAGKFDDCAAIRMLESMVCDDYYRAPYHYFASPISSAHRCIWLRDDQSTEDCACYDTVGSPNVRIDVGEAMERRIFAAFREAFPDYKFDYDNMKFNGPRKTKAEDKYSALYDWDGDTPVTIDISKIVKEMEANDGPESQPDA